MAGSPNYDAGCKNANADKAAPLGLGGQGKNNPSHAADKPDCDSPHWYTPLKRPEWLQIVVAAIGIGVLIWQAILTREAVEAATEASKATKQSADALVASERAWVVGELVPLALRYSDNRWYRFVDETPVAMSNEELAAGDHLQYTLKITNLGKTPAFIVNYDVYSLRTNASKELLAFGKPYQFVAGNSSMELEIINIFEFSKEVTAEMQGFITITVNYQHVFSKTYVGEEFFVYIFSVERTVLQRVVGIPSTTYEKERKQDTEAN